MDVRCPNCGTSFVVGDGSHACVDARNINGIGFLMPETIRNNNVSTTTTEYGTNNNGNNTMEENTMPVQNNTTTNNNATFTMDMLAQAVASYMNGTQVPAQDAAVVDNGNGRAVHSRFYNKAMADGNIYNPYLNRRWIASQFIRLIKANGYNDVNQTIRRRYDWKYAINFLKTETEKLDWLSKHDKVAYKERKCFLSLDDVNGILVDYTKALKGYLNNLVDKGEQDAKGNVTVHIPYYKTIKAGKMKKIVDRNNNIVTSLVPSEDWIHLMKSIDDLATKKHSYNEYYKSINAFNFIKVKYRYNRDNYVSTRFVEVFKKAGAYYTLKNLILFENVMFSSNDNVCDNTKDSTEALYGIKDYEGYRIYAILKKSIYDSNYSI